MVLKKIRLKNYRCFKDIELEFDNELTVLVGENGAGKTTVLSAIVVAISIFLTNFPTSYAVSILKSDARIDRALEEEGGYAVYPVSIYAEAEDNGNSIIWERSLNSAKGKTTIVDAKQMIRLSSQYYQGIRANDEELILPVLLYYGTGRLFDSHREKRANVFKDDDRLNGYIDCMDSAANIKLMYKWFQRKTIERYQRMERGSIEDPALSIVFEPMEYIFKSVSGYSDVKMQYSLSQDELVVWYTDNNGNKMCIPLGQLSAGYRNTISLVADIAYRMVTLNPHLSDNALIETSGIIVIDEIDQHLHPSWQRRIIGDLRKIFPRVQFIISSHSPSVIGSINSKNLRKLSKLALANDYPEIYGKDSNGILSYVFETDERMTDIKDMFETFYSFVDNGDYENAEKELAEIANKVDPDDPELTACIIKLDLARLDMESDDI